MNKSARVLIINMPTKYDRATDQMIPIVDVNTAAAFGELVIVNTGRVVMDGSEDSQKEWRKARESFQDGDYILTIGDVGLLMIASSDIMRRFGRLNLLRWSRETQSYRAQKIEWNWEMEDDDNE